MKYLVVLSAILAAVAARPGFLQYSPLITLPVSQQFHAQDNLGQYTYAYSAPLSAKTESRSLDGVTSGGYSYVDAEGILQNVQYTADAVHGFRVAATNLPVAPKPEEVEAPKPVEDTPEVASAKAAHLAAVEAAKAGDVSADDNDQSSDDSDAVEVGKTAVVPAVQYLQYLNPIQTLYPGLQYYSYSLAPTVHSYGYALPLVYTNGHQVSELPADDAAVAKAKEAHVAAHQEVKAKLSAAGAAIN